MASDRAMALLEAQKWKPPGTGPAFPPPDITRKEWAVRQPLGVPRPSSAPAIAVPKYRRPPSLKEPPVTKILDRCVPGFPDPNADRRPYMGLARGSYNHPFTWGLPYKPARGHRLPPPQASRVVMKAWQ
jgi:hypothetical protein